VALTALPGHALTGRDCKPGDIPALLRLHKEQDRGLACGILRTRAHFSIRWPQWRAARILLDAHGRLCAYFLPRLEPHALIIQEAAAAGPMATQAILHTCASLAAEHGLDTFDLLGPPAHPIHH